jgi:ribulose-5-phosphate 4-epimerase/fuculose-1-phosphate aldolase
LIATSETEAVVPSPAEWQARVDFAAAHRLAVWHGLSEGIFNHFTLAVPTRPDRYYQVPFGLHWSEVTASCLMEVSYDGQVLNGSGEVEHVAPDLPVGHGDERRLTQVLLRPRADARQ